MVHPTKKAMNTHIPSESAATKVAQVTSVNRLVILVALNWSRDKDPRFPLGHASILATLRRAQRPVEQIVVAVNQHSNAADLLNQILAIANAHPVQVIDLAIGAYIWGESLIQQLLPMLRQQGFRGRIIMGGPQVSFMEAGFEAKYPEADIFIRGNSENALLAVTATNQEISFPGVHYAGSNSPLTTGFADLANLPSPWITHDWNREPLKFVRFETMRGCPYSCSFCQHRAPKRDARPNYMPPERIMQEIDIFCDNKVESIAVLDPIFNISPIATQVLEAFTARNFKGQISLQCRAELLKPEFLKVASQLNVTLEFGLQTIHLKESTAIERRNKIEKVDAALKMVREFGINHEVSLIFGLPEQTLESFEESVEWCLERSVPVIKAFPLMLLRGTKLEREAERWSLGQSDDEIPIVVQSATFDRGEWECMNALSEALKLTEGEHPRSIAGLIMTSKSSNSVMRWTPTH